MLLNRMRVLFRLACLVLLFAGGAALGQTGSPQRPFGQLVDLWTSQLDRIAGRAEQPNLVPAEIDGAPDATSEPDDFKRCGYICFWLRRAKPFVYAMPVRQFRVGTRLA